MNICMCVCAYVYGFRKRRLSLSPYWGRTPQQYIYIYIYMHNINFDGAKTTKTSGETTKASGKPPKPPKLRKDSCMEEKYAPGTAIY